MAERPEQGHRKKKRQQDGACHREDRNFPLLIERVLQRGPDQRGVDDHAHIEARRVGTAGANRVLQHVVTPVFEQQHVQLLEPAARAQQRTEVRFVRLGANAVVQRAGHYLLVIRRDDVNRETTVKRAEQIHELLLELRIAQGFAQCHFAAAIQGLDHRRLGHILDDDRALGGGLQLEIHEAAKIHARDHRDDYRGEQHRAERHLGLERHVWPMTSRSLPAVLRDSRSRCAAAASASG